MKNHKSTLIITGAGGWLGSSLLELSKEKTFKDNFNKIILCTLNKEDIICKNKLKKISQNISIQFTWIYGNLLSDDFYRDLTKLISKEENLKVIYAASIIHAKSSKDFLKFNYSSLEKFINKIKKYNLLKFLYISSNSPFGFNKNGVPFNENSKYKPIGNYGKSKKLAEILLLSSFKKEILNIVRAPWFHGLNMPKRQKLFLKKAALGSFPIVFPGENKRSIINTRDLALASINIIKSSSKQIIYWVCEEKSISMNDYINIIQKSAIKNKYIREKNNKFKIKFLLPPLTSSICCLLDRILQKFGIYSQIIHVVGELGMNIEADSKVYRREFSDHIFYPIQESIDLEIKEAFDI